MLVPSNKASIGLHGAEGPGALQKDQNFDSRYRLGGLQSLAAAEPDKIPTLDRCSCLQTKLPSACTAPRDRAPSRKIRTSIVVMGLEGCSPLQPRDPIKIPTLDRCLCRQTMLPSACTAPWDRAPSRKIRTSIVVIGLEGRRPLQPRDPIKIPTLDRCLCRQTKLPSACTAPRDRTPSKTRLMLRLSFSFEARRCL